MLAIFRGIKKCHRKFEEKGSSDSSQIGVLESRLKITLLSETEKDTERSGGGGCSNSSSNTDFKQIDVTTPLVNHQELTSIRYTC